MAKKPILFRGKTTLDIPVEQVLDAARQECQHVLVIGVTPAGAGWWGSTRENRAELLWWIETFKLGLLTEDA